MPSMPDTAEASARAALARFRPHQGFALTPLSQRPETVVFHAVPQGRGRDFVVKLALSAPEQARLIRQGRRQRTVWQGLQGSDAHVPRLFRLDRSRHVLILEHIPGQPHAAVWSPHTAEAVAQSAGHWLRRFHGLTAQTLPFDPHAMIGWLPKGADRNDPRLTNLAALAEGLPAQHAVLHGDFHAGNIITTDHGPYGLDFENDRPGVAWRDAISYLIDATLRGGDPARLGSALAAALHDSSAPDVARFVECHAAIAQLARLGPNLGWGPKRTARAALLHALATGQISFFAS